MPLITLTLCVAVFSMATLAVFHSSFQDNLLQCLGLGLTAISSASYAWAIAQGYPVDAKELLLIIGLATYSAGTLQKVLHYREKPMQGFPPLEV